MRSKIFLFSTLSLFFIAWDLYINLAIPDNELQRGFLTDTYGVVALVAAIMGILVSRDWGGKYSFVGKALIFLSMGLLMQFLGNLSYTLIYYLTNIENPYPAFGEVFYVLSVPLYIFGIWYLGISSGALYKLKTKKGKTITICITITLLIASYLLFIYNKVDMSEPILSIVLEYYYPMAQTLFVALAICTFVLSTELLGGIMRARVLFILFALVFQYFADGVFLYNTRNDLWQPAGVSDLMFIFSYFLMGLGLILYENAAKKILTPDL
jgi:hypothetical protein